METLSQSKMPWTGLPLELSGDVLPPAEPETWSPDVSMTSAERQDPEDLPVFVAAAASWLPQTLGVDTEWGWRRQEICSFLRPTH